MFLTQPTTHVFFIAAYISNIYNVLPVNSYEKAWADSITPAHCWLYSDANLYEYTYTPTYSSGLLGMSTALNGSQHLKFIWMYCNYPTETPYSYVYHSLEICSSGQQAKAPLKKK